MTLVHWTRIGCYSSGGCWSSLYAAGPPMPSQTLEFAPGQDVEYEEALEDAI